ncbi:MAG: DUF1801 domain-containing protein [Spirochaetales bacterium]
MAGNLVDQYIETCDPAVQPLLRELQSRLAAWIPGAEQRIAYGLATFYWHENVVHFGAFTKHVGFYPTSSGIAAFSAEFGGRKWSKGAVQFPLAQPLPWDLIERMVKFRVAEVTARAAAKPKGARKGS